MGEMGVKGRRASGLGPAEIFLLDQWGRQIHEAFGHVPYLTGSVARDEPWRDVDVRLILPDDEFLELFGSDQEPYGGLPFGARLITMNVAFTVWGQRVTGLPVDFQFQSMTVANRDENRGPRNPLGTRALHRAASL